MCFGLNDLVLASSSQGFVCVCVCASVSIDCKEWAWVMVIFWCAPLFNLLSYTSLASNRVKAHRARKEQSGCMSLTILPSSDSEGSGVNRDHRMQPWKWFKKNLKGDINVTSAIHDLLRQEITFDILKQSQSHCVWVRRFHFHTPRWTFWLSSSA